MIIVYRVMLYTFVLRYANADQLNLVQNDRPLPWTKAFGACDDPTYWYQIFNDCQPETCNASSVADRIINAPRFGRLQYWMYGYVLRSPIIGNIGCFSLDTNVKNAFHRGIFLVENNSAFECSIACPDNSVEYIFLRGRECLCVTKKKFIEQLYNDKLTEENTGTCNQSCAGNTGDLCGGSLVVIGKLLFSVYQVLTRRISNHEVGSTCAELSFDANKQIRYHYTACTSNRMYICGRYNKSSKSYIDTCSNETVSWYAAQQKCQELGYLLRLYTSFSFSTPCAQKGQMFWIGNHVAEKFVWGNDALPIDPFCLMLVITESRSSFETENCRTRLYSLCYTRQPTNAENDESGTTTCLSQLNRTTITAAVDRSTENYPIYITAVSIVFVLGVIIATIAFCIKRRFRQKLYTSVVPAQPQIYSDLNTNPYDEITELDMPQNLDEDGYEMPRSAKITTLG